MQSGTAPVAMERLRELTGPELYQRNAFRLTGLPTTATRQAIRRCRQQINTAVRAGVDIPAAGELPVPGRRSAEQYGAVFDVLDHPQRRIVDELFWIWDAPDGACGCDPALHEAHDSAVRAHAWALDEELGGRAAPPAGEPSWGAAAAGWQRALAHPGFWGHVTHRITALDDVRIGPAAVPVLEGEVRRTLVAPMAELATGGSAPHRVTALFGAWSWAGGNLLGQAVEGRVEPVLEAVRTALERARDLHTENPAAAASIVEREVLPRLDGLCAFDSEGVRRSIAKVRERTALLLNNCAVSTDGGTPLPAAEAARLLDLAIELAETEETRELVADNRAHVEYLALLPAMDRAHTLLEEDQPWQAAAALQKEVLPLLAELRTSDDKEARDNAAKFTDGAAILLNNCALALAGDSSPSAVRTRADFLDQALELAETRRTRKLVRKNRRQAARHARIAPYSDAFRLAVSGLERAQRLLRDNRPGRAAAEIESHVVPHTDKLAECRVRKVRRPAARLADQTAILLNNCALALDPVGTSPEESRRLLSVAHGVARKRKTRALIMRNSVASLATYADHRLDDLPPSIQQIIRRMPPEKQAHYLSQLRDRW
ncbi:hypothetical protein [Streptomyces sp. CMB-StM0423]|uniref:hypothetical protein n=1 Tax=Streptomyces sp. CMB-StM0423 TaxID=2059884 RepID=UPI000C710EF5|nr:hypothetical protein [Streptomyces sp. CMB-StM0423]AUH39611.1 hypothetical protein CXR04_04515 [Streptomyces sp. CMB-StM0423]